MNDNSRFVRAPRTAELLSPSQFDGVNFSHHEFASDRLTAAAGATTGEDLVADARGNLTPAQMVERKLVQLLRGNPMPVSHMLSKGHR